MGTKNKVLKPETWNFNKVMKIFQESASPPVFFQKKIQAGIGQTFMWVFLGILLGACGRVCGVREEVLRIPMEIEVENLGKTLLEIEGVGSMDSFLTAQPVLRRKFFREDPYSTPGGLAEGLYKTLNNPHIDTLYQEVIQEYGEDFADLKIKWVQAFQHVKYYYPSFSAPKINLIISGLYRDVYFSENLWIMSMDYFLGEQAKYPPIDLPLYLRRRYTPQHVIPMSLFYLSTNYTRNQPHDLTLLADMIAWGKSCFFVEHMIPCAEDSLIIGYSQEELNRVREYAPFIWANFIEKAWLYERSPKIKNKFVGERPNVPEIGVQCPGRIGIWLGWEIVRAYFREQGGAWQKILKEPDAQKIFRKSRYNPS
ncbi:MAG: gliding motility lipoprotein GldB [Cytophagales bacterium]|nr:gliding motility lipoprotein GldB [Cytophagales bacterium]